jgi:signal transduction histidine kinase
VSRPGPLSERAIILAPTGRDGPLAAQILKEAGFPAEICASLPALVEELEKGAGLAIIADEAVHGTNLRPLASFLERQPPWSDLPVILLTHHGGGPERSLAAARFAEILGNASFLERPFHAATMASMVRSAVRSRRRQYDARRRLEELIESEQRLASERARLADLTRTLEQRVQERTAELMVEVGAREKAQEQLIQSQKMESMGHLAGGIAHDFNNILAAVIGNLELLRKRLPEGAAARRLIDGAIQGAERGASLSRRMLAFARQQELKSSPADIAALLEGMQNLLDRSLGPRVALSFHIAPELPPAQIDANQVELAILNLAINASDAMPEGGAIDITVDCQQGGPAQKLQAGSYVRVEVADTGCGMDDATLKKAIEPFFSTKPVGKGTGLGLSMVHGLAVQLGGALELSSEPGKGTVATLWFPAATEPAVARGATAQEARAGASATILVVDDDRLVAMSTVGMLEDIGHTVIEANSAKRALEILEAGQAVDLMVTDQAMPGMTGLELVKIVRGKCPHMPVLLTTGYGDIPVGQGSNLPSLSKPYRQAQLQAEIERLLRKTVVPST